MAQLVSVEELEATINRVRRETPPVNGGLSPELCVLAEIYGRMIYARERSVDLDQLPENIRPTAVRLLARPSMDSLADAGSRVCAYGPNAETCDVCQ